MGRQAGHKTWVPKGAGGAPDLPLLPPPPHTWHFPCSGSRSGSSRVVAAVHGVGAVTSGLLLLGEMLPSLFSTENQSFFGHLTYMVVTSSPSSSEPPAAEVRAGKVWSGGGVPVCGQLMFSQIKTTGELLHSSPLVSTVPRASLWQMPDTPCKRCRSHNVHCHCAFLGPLYRSTQNVALSPPRQGHACLCGAEGVGGRDEISVMSGAQWVSALLVEAGIQRKRPARCGWETTKDPSPTPQRGEIAEIQQQERLR